MSLPHNLFATAFRQQRVGLMFATIMVIMVYLATLAMAMQMALAGVTYGVGSNLSKHMTVEIPAAPDNNETVQANQLDQVMAKIKNMPEIGQIKPLPKMEVMRLLKPWITDSEVVKSLPIPKQIDIDLAAGRSITATNLQRQLMLIDDDIQVNDRAEWLEQLLLLINGLSAIAWLMISLTGLSLIVAIVLICRTIMAMQHDTIELLHLMGATDRDIAHQFQRHAWRLAWRSAFMGFFLAFLSIVGIAMLLVHFLIAPPTIQQSWLMFVGVIASVPIIAIIVAIITARLSAMTLLRQMP